MLVFGSKWWSLGVWMAVELVVGGWKVCSAVRICCSKVCCVVLGNF